MSLQEAIDQATGGSDSALSLAAPEPVPPVASNSVLAAARARAQELQAEQSVDLTLPGYENVVGRYRAVSIAQFNSTAGGEVRLPFLDWRAAADALVTALDSLYGITDTGELVPLYGDGPCRYDGETCELLGLTPSEPTARAAMVAIFGGGGKGESRIWQHFLSYQTWLMEGTAPEVAGRAVGESPAS